MNHIIFRQNRLECQETTSLQFQFFRENVPDTGCSYEEGSLMGGCFAFGYGKLGGSTGGRLRRSRGSDGWDERKFNVDQTIYYFVEEYHIQVLVPIANG